jgi:hypothetical protein
MHVYRALTGLLEALLIVAAVWLIVVGGGIGLFWLIGWLLGAQ